MTFMRNFTRVRAVFALCLGLTGGGFSTSAIAGSLAIFRIDPLGVNPQIVTRLEGLLRLELSRLAYATIPRSAEIRSLVRRNPELQDCTGELGCLITVGKLLNVERVISGNVGGLGESYVVNLKIIDVQEGRELRRIQEPISGDPNQLIEAVRVAAYGLVAPERLRGAITVLADQPQAQVILDGRPVGKTPLATLHGLKVGKHYLRVTKAEYKDVEETVQVRFQKVAQVMVKLEPPQEIPSKPTPKPARPYPWYTRWWFWTIVGVAATGVGFGLGMALSDSGGSVDCGLEPARCGL